MKFLLILGNLRFYYSIELFSQVEFTFLEQKNTVKEVEEGTDKDK